MSVQSIDLVWIAVKDLKKAVKLYTETVGLKLVETNEQWGWAELQGHIGGARLGIAQINDSKSELQVGENQPQGACRLRFRGAQKARH